MNRGFRKAAVIALSACLAATSLAGCSKKEEFNAEAAAVTINDTTISAGLVKFVSHYMQAGSESFYTQYLGTNPFNQVIDEAGSTLGDMVVEGTVDELKQMVLAEQHMEELGVSLTDEEKEAIAAAAADFIAANEEEVLTEMGATEEIVARYLELYTIQDKAEPVMAEDIDTEVSDEEAAQRKVQYVLFTAETESETEVETEDGTEVETEVETEAETAAETTVETEVETEAETAAETETETAALEENDAEKTESAEETEVETETETEDPAMAAAKEAAYAEAAEMIALIQEGEEFEAAAQAVDPDANAIDITFGEDERSFYEELAAATDDLEDGTLVETPVEVTSGYYVVKLISNLDREATDEKKEEILEERKADRITELYTEWEEAAEVKQDDDVLAKIVFDFSLTMETEAATEVQTEAVETETEEVTEAVETETEEVTEAVETETEEVTEAAETETEEVTEAIETETEEVTEAAETETEEVTEAAETEAK